MVLIEDEGYVQWFFILGMCVRSLDSCTPHVRTIGLSQCLT